MTDKCKCEYCGAELSNMSALNKHQKLAQYCIDIQKTNEKLSDKETLIKTQQDLIEKLKQEVSDLKNGTIINNSYNNNTNSNNTTNKIYITLLKSDLQIDNEKTSKLISEKLTKTVYDNGSLTELLKTMVSTLLVDEKEMPTIILLNKKEDKFAYLENGKLTYESGVPKVISLWSKQMKRKCTEYHKKKMHSINSHNINIQFDGDNNYDIEYNKIEQKLVRLKNKDEHTDKDLRKIKKYENQLKDIEELMHSSVIGDDVIDSAENHHKKMIKKCEPEKLTNKIKPIIRDIQDNTIEKLK